MVSTRCIASSPSYPKDRRRPSLVWNPYECPLLPSFLPDVMQERKRQRDGGRTRDGLTLSIHRPDAGVLFPRTVCEQDRSAHQSIEPRELLGDRRGARVTWARRRALATPLDAARLRQRQTQHARSNHS